MKRASRNNTNALKNNNSKKAKRNNTVRPTIQTNGLPSTQTKFFNLYSKLGLQRPIRTMKNARSPENLFRPNKNNNSNSNNSKMNNWEFLGEVMNESNNSGYNYTYNFRQNHAPYNSNQSVMNVNEYMILKANKKSRKAKARR
jgi:hypothetical protein